MPQAKWTRVSPGILAAANPQRGGTMIMATLAKKHLTVFVRSRRAPGAGHIAVKTAFAAAAAGTRKEPNRMKRNAAIAAAVRGNRPGKSPKKSRSAYI